MSASEVVSDYLSEWRKMGRLGMYERLQQRAISGDDGSNIVTADVEQRAIAS